MTSKTIIHDFEAGIMRCQDCHRAAIARRDIPARRIAPEGDSIFGGAMTYQADESGTALCDECGA